MKDYETKPLRHETNEISTTLITEKISFAEFILNNKSATKQTITYIFRRVFRIYQYFDYLSYFPEPLSTSAA